MTKNSVIKEDVKNSVIKEDVKNSVTKDKMNNYKRIKARQEKFIAELEHLLTFIDRDKLDDRAREFVGNYANSFKSQRTSKLKILFPEVGTKITVKEAFNKSAGTIILDARQVYQAKKQGIKIEKVKGKYSSPADTVYIRIE